MGKFLCGFYLLVGVLSTISIFTSFIAGKPVLSAWLIFAAMINFFLFYLIWQSLEQRAKPKRYKHLRLVK